MHKKIHYFIYKLHFYLAHHAHSHAKFILFILKLVDVVIVIISFYILFHNDEK